MQNTLIECAANARKLAQICREEAERHEERAEWYESRIDLEQKRDQRNSQTEAA